MKTPAVSTNLRNVVCPGGTASCPDGNTCCKLSSGEYGCCPLPNVSDSFFYVLFLKENHILCLTHVGHFSFLDNSTNIFL